MRYLKWLVAFAALLSTEVLIVPAASQDISQAQTSAQEKAASLRSQLTEVETKQADLQTRLQKLDESLKPENIANNLAGVGSTKPEELREQRRRQLEIERNGVKAQLDLLATSHTRLETAIAHADADAYRQSAAPVTAPTVSSATSTPASAPASVTTPTTPRRVRRSRRRKARVRRN